MILAQLVEGTLTIRWPSFPPPTSTPRNSNGFALLHRAAFTGDVGLASFPLDHGAHPHIKNKCGR